VRGVVGTKLPAESEAASDISPKESNNFFISVKLVYFVLWIRFSGMDMTKRAQANGLHVSQL
ncbi:MAG: hypothetical protein K2F96_03275, partial [Muribaculaceae bacterium]|nr:hypothetical protein [Muribaculaceae bacterium]